MTDDIVAFIQARLDEDERTALATTGGGMPWHAQARSELRTAPAGSVGRNSDPDWSIHWVQIAVEGSGPSHGDRSGFDSRPDFHHIATHDPARALRGVEAKRRIAELHEPVAGFSRQQCTLCVGCWSTEEGEDWPCQTLRLLASEWSTHPDYRPDSW